MKVRQAIASTSPAKSHGNSNSLFAWFVVVLTLGAISTVQYSASAFPPPPQQGTPPTQQRDQRINQALGLNTSDISTAVITQGPANTLTADLVIRGKRSLVRMTRNSVRAPGHKLIAQVADGGYVEVDPGPSKTYWGSMDNDAGAVAGGSMISTGLFATVRFADGQQYWIEPIAPRVPGEAPNLYVSYRTEDVTECQGVCGTEGESIPLPPQAQASQLAGTGLAGSVGTSCVAQIACDADREYFVKYGNSTSAVNDRIELVINSLNIEYASEVGITHTIGTVFVRTAEPDPYTSVSANGLMDELQDQWVDNHGAVSRDVVHLFTDKNLNGGTIGLGYIGAICSNTFGYSLVESDSDPNFGCTTDLSAHELGHNWNAGHCDCVNPPYTMNSYNVCSNHFHPTESIPVITAYRDSRGCIECGPLLEFKFNVSGTGTAERLGKSVAIINDVNSDGVPDVIIGIPENDTGGVNKGKVTVVSGATGNALWSRYGYFAGDQLGYSVAACGSKVVVGAPYNDDFGSDAGAVYIYNGANGTLLKKKVGQTAGDRFGWSVSGDVDVNDDASPDFIVGAPYNDSTASNSGAVYVYNGSTYSTLKKIKGEAAKDRFGFSVALLGNVNFDDYGDFVVGAPYNKQAGSNAGKVYVYSGQNYALLLPALLGARAGDQFGRCVAAVGRVNSDSRSDFAVGAPYYDVGANLSVGRVNVYSGATGSLLFAKNGSVADDQLGTAISTAGDVDHDGQTDVLAGAPRNDQAFVNAGQVYVYSGRTGATLARFRGEVAGDTLGAAVAGLADEDGAWLTFASALHNGAASDSGRAYVYASPASGALAASTLPEPLNCTGDITGNDGVVDADDLLAVITHWAVCTSPCPPTCVEDINQDCKVDATDLQLVIASWGTCP